jgi:hypothetical protein
MKENRWKATPGAVSSSDAAKQRWTDPAYKARIAEARRDCGKTRSIERRILPAIAEGRRKSRAGSLARHFFGDQNPAWQKTKARDGQDTTDEKEDRAC